MHRSLLIACVVALALSASAAGAVQLDTAVPEQVGAAAVTPTEEVSPPTGVGAGTRQLAAYDVDVLLGPDVAASPSDVTVLGDQLVFTAIAPGESPGRRLFVTDGTPEGTRLVPGFRSAGSSPASDLTALGPWVYFHADGMDGSGDDLWRTDGDTVERVGVPGTSNARPRHLAVYGNNLYFQVSGTDQGLWRTDGQTVEAAPGAEATRVPRDLTAFDGRLWFADLGPGLSDPVVLMAYDGTSVEAFDAVAYPQDFAIAGDALWFAADHGDDRTQPHRVPAGGAPQSMGVINPDRSARAEGFTAALGDVWFRANTAEGNELVRWDGGVGASARYEVFSLAPGTDDSYPEELTVFDGTLYFTADVPGVRRSLWRIDDAGDAELVTASFADGQTGGIPADLVEFEGALWWGNQAQRPVVESLWRLTPTDDLQRVDLRVPRDLVVFGDHLIGSAFMEPTGRGLFAVTARPDGPGGPPPPPLPDGVTRIAGDNRFDTAVRLSRAGFPDGADVAYIATGGDFPDALAGGAAAALDGGPLLLATPEVVPPPVIEELSRLAPQRIVLLGGAGALSAAVAEQITAEVPGAEALRVQGSDRFATAAAVSTATFPDGADVAYVATGGEFADALAAGALAGVRGGPVLLTGGPTLPPATADELSRLAPAEVVVLGGVGAIPDEIVTQIGAAAGGATIVRRGGQDRFDTAATLVADRASAETVVIATGQAFPDALAGVVLAARSDAPLLLVARNAVPAPTAAAIDRLAPRNLIILGGSAAIAPETEGALDALLGD